MHTYHLEFILHTYHATLQEIRNALAEFGDCLAVSESPPEPGMRGTNFQIAVCAEEPTLVFDTCAHFGRIKSVKVQERLKAEG